MGSTTGRTWTMPVTVALGSVAVLGALVVLAAAGQAQVSCYGKAPTIVAQPGIVTTGTTGPDVILGTDGDDVIRGLGGADRICSLGGDDDVTGGGGRDRIDLGPGDDLAGGGPGDDLIQGKRGDDTINGNKGADTVRGGSDDDTLDGGGGADTCVGGEGRDAIWSCGTRDRAAFFVSMTGDDNDVGSLAEPFATLRRGMRRLRPGDTLYARGGVYREFLEITRSGSADDGFITIRNYPGETPIIDGTTLTPGRGWSPLIGIRDQSYVRVKGFELRDLTSTRSRRVPVGVLVAGQGHHVEVLDNEIHHIAAEASGARNGHGIAVFGTATTPITDVIIDGNDVHDLTLGTSEAVVLNGNVADFVVSNNRVHDVDNIGIDVIGYEGVGPTRALDRARDGVIRNNHVWNVDATGNPSYNEASAGGIYVDGGLRITVEANLVHDNNIGIELASEEPGGVTADVTVRHNVIWDNDIGGVLVGGFDDRRGATSDCLIAHNTFVTNDRDRRGNGELVFRFDVRGCGVRNNIFRATTQGVFLRNDIDLGNRGITVDHNLYFTTGERTWRWLDDDYGTLGSWRRGTGNDEASGFGDPDFVDRPAGDFRLRPTSPAIGAGSAGGDLGADIAAVGPE